MRLVTTFFLFITALALSAQTGTIQVEGGCFGVGVVVDFVFEKTENGRNQYIDDDGDPNTNPSLRFAYNTNLSRWEIQDIINPLLVFYASETNTFAPDPPDSTVSTYTGQSGCENVGDGKAIVSGTGTQATDGTICEGIGDADNDGVCDDADVCPGSDDGMDRDGDGTPDGCDTAFDGVAVTTDCFGGTLDFVLSGTDATGRNVYTNAAQGFELAFNMTLMRWEVRVANDVTNIFYTNDLASAPNPPSSEANPYTPTGSCSQPATVTGGGTQDTRCVVTCDDGNDCTDDVLDANCVCQYTSNDVTPPVAVCQDVEVFVDASGNATLEPEDIDGGSSDNCGDVILSVNVTSFNCGTDNLVVTPVTLTVTDGAGLQATCTAEVTVSDTTAPVITCQDATIELDENRMGIISAQFAFSEVLATYTDNCGTAPQSLDIDRGRELTCDDLGPLTVAFTFKDESLNEASCTVTLTVTDPTDACMSTAVGDATAPARAVLLQNRPNPVTGETVISFRLLRPGKARLSLHDVTGRTFLTREVDAREGLNQLTIHRDELQTSGLLLYTLTANGFSGTRKMVVR